MRLSQTHLFAMIGMTLAQTNDCIYLDSTSICGPDFIDQPMHRQILDLPFDSVKQFNENFSNQFLNATNVADSFNTALECSKGDVISQFSSIRFQLSFQCSFYLNKSIKEQKCPPKSTTIPNGPLLCKTQCDIYQRSVSSMVASPACPQSLIISLFADSVSLACADFAKASDANANKYCSNGTDNEYKNCGWPKLEIGKKYCSEMPQKDACCNRILRVGAASSSGVETKVFLWWHILLITLAGAILICGLILTILCCKKRKNAVSKRQKTDDIKAEEGKAKAEPVKEDKINCDKAEVVQNKAYPSSEKGKKLNPQIKKERTPIKRTMKNKITLADDLAKERAKADQSINSLMNFFGAGSVSHKKSLVNGSGRLQVTFSSDVAESDRTSNVQTDESSQLFQKSPQTNLRSLPPPKSKSSPAINLPKSPESNDSNNSPSLIVADPLLQIQKETDSMKTVVVIQTYEALSADELNLVIGELIHVKQEFDDGWAVGIEQRSKKEGVFPLMCIGNLVIPSTKE